MQSGVISRKNVASGGWRGSSVGGRGGIYGAVPSSRKIILSPGCRLPRFGRSFSSLGRRSGREPLSMGASSFSLKGRG